MRDENDAAQAALLDDYASTVAAMNDVKRSYQQTFYHQEQFIKISDTLTRACPQLSQMIIAAR